MTLLIILAVLILIMFTKISVIIGYNEAATIKLKILFFVIKIYPRKNKDKHVKKKKDKKEKKIKKSKKKDKKKKTQRKPDTKAILSTLDTLIEIIKSITGYMLKTLTINKFNLELLIASGDPMKTALTYSGVCTAVYNTWAMIENILKVRVRHIRISPDFLSEKMRFKFYLDISTTPGKLFAAFLKTLFIMLKYKDVLKNMINQRDAGPKPRDAEPIIKK